MDIQIENIENVTVVHLKGSFDSSALFQTRSNTINYVPRCVNCHILC